MSTHLLLVVQAKKFMLCLSWPQHQQGYLVTMEAYS